MLWLSWNEGKTAAIISIKSIAESDEHDMAEEDGPALIPGDTVLVTNRSKVGEFHRGCRWINGAEIRYPAFHRRSKLVPATRIIVVQHWHEARRTVDDLLGIASICYLALAERQIVDSSAAWEIWQLFLRCCTGSVAILSQVEYTHNSSLHIAIKYGENDG